MSTSKCEPSSSFRVSYPFDTSIGTHADMVLRSADGIDFRVMKGILALSSTIFQDMASLAKPLTTDGKRASADVSGDGLPIVTMYESDAIVVDALLRIIYPGIPPELDNIDLISGLLCCAQKYDMTVVLRVLENTLGEIARDNNGERALAVYVLAWEHRLEDILRVAVREFLKCPSKQAYFSGLEKVPASALFHLFEHRRMMADKIDMLFAPLMACHYPQFRCVLRDIECSTRSVKPAEGCGSTEAGYHVSGWWTAFRESVRREIQRAPSSDDAVSISSIYGAVRSTKCCLNCKEKVLSQLPDLERTIKQEMHKLAEQVPFDIPW